MMPGRSFGGDGWCFFVAQAKKQSLPGQPVTTTYHPNRPAKCVGDSKGILPTSLTQRLCPMTLGVYDEDKFATGFLAVGNQEHLDNMALAARE